MKKKEVINKISKDAIITKGVATLALESVLSSIVKAIKTGDRVSFSNFGSFVPVYRKEKKVLHPKTKEPILIPEKLTMKFKPAQHFLEELNEINNKS